MSALQANPFLMAGGVGGGYEIERSLRFTPGDSAYLNRTPSSAGNRKRWTWSGWVKRSGTAVRNHLFAVHSSNDNSGYFRLAFQTDGVLIVGLWSKSILTTVAKFRDFSAWYHVVLVLDTGNPTAADQVILYVNGVRQSVTGTADSNADYAINSTQNHYIGWNTGTSQYFNGYLADVHFLDGQALAPTDFGVLDDNGVWQAIEFAGSYGWFNTSQTWSNLVTGTLDTQYGNSSAAAPFQGSTGSSYSDGIRPTTGNYLSMNFGSTFANATKLTIYGHASLNGVAYTGTNENLKINGTALTASEWTTNGGSGGQSSATFTLSNGLTSLEWGYGSGSQSSGYLYLQGIEVDGKLLTNSGVSVTDNSFHLDFADNSSNAALGTDTSGNNNTWTVNNLNASTTAVDTVGATSGLIGSNMVVDVQGSYNFAHVYSKIASNPGDQAYVKVDFSSLGLSAPATITFDSYQQGGGGWSLVPSTVYTDAGNTTSSFTYSSNTRSNTISIPSGATYFAIPPSWTSAAGGILSNGIKNLVWNGTAVNFYDGDSDSLRDSPSQIADQSDTGAGGEVVGNYATLNPLHKGVNASLTNGNLQVGNTTTWGTTISTIGMSAGKWYAELTLSGSINYTAFGVSSIAGAYVNSYMGQTADSYCWFAYTGGGLYTGGAYTDRTGDWNVSCAVGDVIGLALDMDNGTLKYYKNGTLLGGGNAFTGITGTQFFGTCGWSQIESWNFGQRAFANTNVPSGYKALCTANLPEPTIADGSKYFDTKLWTGNGGTQTISGLNMSPDFVWVKRRDGGTSHFLYDIVRGFSNGNAYELRSSGTNAEGVPGTANSGLTAFNSDGFSLGSDGGANGPNDTFVGWVWDAGDSNTTIAVGSLNGSAYDQSQTWSNYVTGTPYSATYPVTNAFNGNLSQGSRSLASSGAGHTFTPPSAITVNSSLRIWIGYGDASATNVLKVNGTDYSSLITSTGYNIGWITIPGISSITSIFYGVTPSGSEDSSVAAIEVDGKILIDSGVSVANVPSIASTVRANPSAGFSIVSYSGSSSAVTVGHGLNAAPEMIIIKDRDSGVYNWQVAHIGIGADDSLLLNSANAKADYNAWNNTRPTSTVFSLGAGILGVNTNGNNMIAYCFAPVEGYSAMGSYTGNGSADGPFVFTGFKISWLMVKSSSNSGEHWLILDAARDSYNVADATIYANLTNAESEASVLGIDILSNGFKPRGTNAGTNASGYTYIYVAFAEHPFKTARAR